jgi:UDP-N-acetylglucosamine:LPS N-acetylglucosamine transferase
MLKKLKKSSQTIAVIYFDAASGHRSAAAALQKALLRARPEYEVSMVNIVDVFDHHKLFGKVVRMGIDYFNGMIRKDKVVDLRGLINLSLLCNDLVGRRGLGRISSYWKKSPPDVVVSVTPMYNPVLFKSALLVNPEVKCITIPVDFEEVRTRYWFTPAVKQFYLNATERLSKQALAAGVDPENIYSIGGMPADEDAYHSPREEKSGRLKQLGLNPEYPTGFLSFGGQGTSNVLDIANALSRLALKFNMIIMCGKNEKLFNAVNQLLTAYPKAVFSYLPETPINYLHLADFAIGKPGAMTITEALVTRTPLIALKSKGMSPVQRGNEDWMEHTKTGIVAPTPEKAAQAVAEILNNPVYQQNIEKYYHRSIHECTELIDQIIHSKKGQLLHV